MAERLVKLVSDIEAIGPMYRKMISDRASAAQAKEILEGKGYSFGRARLNHLLIIGRRDDHYYAGVLAGEHSHLIGPVLLDSPRMSCWSDHRDAKRYIASKYLKEFRNANVVLTNPQTVKHIVRAFEDLGCVVEKLHRG